MVAVDAKTIGLFTRFERIFLLFICLLIGRVAIALWGLAIFNSLSALQRVAYTLRAVHNQGVSSKGTYRSEATGVEQSRNL
jgi:hypothetical protein